MSTPEPPRKRYRFELHLDAHDFDHIADELRRIASEAEREGLPWRRVSGAGYWFDLNDSGSTLTRDEYDEALEAWFRESRPTRKEANK
jgi:hypothetical protein